MLDNSYSIDRPVTLRDIEQLLTAVTTESFYIKAEDYRKKIGLGKTQFIFLKKLGRFDAGTHKATLGSRRILIHRYFNMHSQKIEWFGKGKIIPNKNIEKSKKIKQQEELLQRDIKNEINAFAYIWLIILLIGTFFNNQKRKALEMVNPTGFNTIPLQKKT